jgi:hypothetical protein
METLKSLYGASYGELARNDPGKIFEILAQRNSFMKRILCFGLMLVLSSLPALAAKNSQSFFAPSAVRVGDTQLPQGHFNVTWTDPSGSQVQLTIKAANKKTITVPAQIIEEPQSNTGVVTSDVNGVTYLQELHTSKARFILQNNASASK